jgi:hypothetical protein
MRGIPVWVLAGLLAATAMLAAPGIARGQVLGDSVVASGDTAASFTNIDINVAGGPSGENPTGQSAATLGAERFRSASITCLSVSGNTAVVGGSLQPNSVGLAGFVETLVDNGPANSGLDTFTAVGISTVPTVCPPPDPLGNPLITGDIVVVDVPPTPTSADQCKNRGWRNFGSTFKNQGDCVSYVATMGKNQPSGH